MIHHLNIKIYGRVQGVFFRHSARERAKELDLKGFVRNEPDDAVYAVYIEVEGEKDRLDKLLEWCRKGPPLAIVEKIEFDYSDQLKNFKEFEIV